MNILWIVVCYDFFLFDFDDCCLEVGVGFVVLGFLCCLFLCFEFFFDCFDWGWGLMSFEYMEN